MALTKTDKLEIERLIRKEIKDFMKKPQYKNELKKMIQLMFYLNYIKHSGLEEVSGNQKLKEQNNGCKI
mgnify:CR=1 FL=1